MWPAKLSSSRYFMRSWISYAIAGLILLDVLSVVFLGGHIHSARIFIFRKKDLPPLFVQYSSTGTNVKLWVNPRLSQDTTFSEWTIDPDAIERTIDQHRPNVRVLVLTPMKDSSKHLSLYFALLDRMTYPKSLMSLGILEGDSSDDTYDKVYSNFEDLIRRGEYRRLTLIKKNFRNGNKALTGKERHGFAIQGQRRSVQAKCRNHLQSIALADEEVVLWLDSDLRQYPSDIIERMLATKKPIVSADCIQSDGYCYDRNNWRETGASLAFKQRLRPDELMFEGYPEVMLTHRESLCDIKTGIDGNGLVEIDGVGGTALMIYSDLIREGLFFPTFPFRHAIETEGVAQVAQAMGVKVYGLANLKVFHDAA